MNTTSTTNPFADADLVHRYTRAETIRDGMLVDMSKPGREAGFSIPVAVTAAVFDQCVRWTEDDTKKKPKTCQNEDGRLWDVMSMAACKARLLARAGNRSSTALFQLLVVPRPGHGRRRLRTLKLTIGPGDDAEPVATILLPDED